MTFSKTLIGLALCGLTGAAIAADIVIVQASYGLSCNPNLRGNLTEAVRQACKGTSICRFTIDHTRHGDPAPNCKKDFLIEYGCGSGPERKLAGIAAEATKQTVTLDCPQQ